MTQSLVVGSATSTKKDTTKQEILLTEERLKNENERFTTSIRQVYKRTKR